MIMAFRACHVLLCCCFIVADALANNDTDPDALEDLPNYQELPAATNLWGRLLWKATNGMAVRDLLSERLISQVFEAAQDDNFAQRNDTIFGELDPLKLWPIQEPIKKKAFSADFFACDVRMHNLRSAKLVDVQVYRNTSLNTLSGRLHFEFPILWMTGYYTLTRSYLFRLIPVKSRKGDFNIDIKDVTAVIVFTLQLNDNDEEEADQLPVIRHFEVGLDWEDVDVKFERIAGRFTTLADLTIYQLGLADLVTRSERVRVVDELEFSFRGLFHCTLTSSSSGVDLCMRKWWEQRGWYWPWVYPECPRDT